MELRNIIRELNSSLKEVEDNMLGMADVLSKLDTALKASQLDQLREGVKKGIEELRRVGEDVKDIRVEVLYRGKVRLVSSRMPSSFDGRYPGGF